MHHRRKVYDTVFLATAVLGALFIITELIFQSFGKSICPTEGCKVISQHSRFGDVSILLIGLVTFAALAVLSFLSQYRNRSPYERYINLILVVSLAAEGFFVGYQAFSIKTACVVCLITFCFFLVLAILRLFSGEKEVIAGFMSFAGVFALFYLILPAGGTVHLPEEELILFYSKDCKYCTEVIEKIKANNINVAHLLAGEYSGFLKNMQIEHVPTLFVNKKNQKMFLTGKEAIDQYLFCKPEAQGETTSGPEAATKSKKEVSSRGNTGSGESNKAFIPLNNPSDIILHSADEGVCSEDRKQDEKCE
jgi:hypothetical protein